MSILTGFGSLFTHITGMIDNGAHGAVGDLHATSAHATNGMINPFMPTNDSAGTQGGNLPIHTHNTVNTTNNTLPDGVNKIVMLYKKPRS